MNYNLEYYINNRLVETIVYNKPKPLCLSIKNKLSEVSHKAGIFKLKLWK
jgi:hypothetical protein